jgi:hypothetical protein
VRAGRVHGAWRNPQLEALRKDLEVGQRPDCRQPRRPGPRGDGKAQLGADAGRFAGGQDDGRQRASLRAALSRRDLDPGLVAQAPKPELGFLLLLAGANRLHGLLRRTSSVVSRSARSRSDDVPAEWRAEGLADLAGLSVSSCASNSGTKVPGGFQPRSPPRVAEPGRRTRASRCRRKDSPSRMRSRIASSRVRTASSSSTSFGISRMWRVCVCSWTTVSSPPRVALRRKMWKPLLLRIGSLNSPWLAAPG